MMGQRVEDPHEQASHVAAPDGHHVDEVEEDRLVFERVGIMAEKLRQVA